MQKLHGGYSTDGRRLVLAIAKFLHLVAALVSQILCIVRQACFCMTSQCRWGLCLLPQHAIIFFFRLSPYSIVWPDACTATATETDTAYMSDSRQTSIPLLLLRSQEIRCILCEHPFGTALYSMPIRRLLLADHPVGISAGWQHSQAPACAVSH